jgi:hypothetical protein
MSQISVISPGTRTRARRRMCCAVGRTVPEVQVAVSPTAEARVAGFAASLQHERLGRSWDEAGRVGTMAVRERRTNCCLWRVLLSKSGPKATMLCTSRRSGIVDRFVIFGSSKPSFRKAIQLQESVIRRKDVRDKLGCIPPGRIKLILRQEWCLQGCKSALI